MKINDIVEQYIDMRNAVAEKKKEFEKFKRDTELEMKELELKLLEHSNETGVDSFKTANGTAYKTTKTHARCVDRGAMETWAKETGDFSLFTTHVAKTHVRELIEDGIDPETFGVDYVEEQVIQVRKA